MQTQVIKLADHAPSPSWENPDMAIMRGGSRPAPIFPSDVLGEFWADWCDDVAASANAPIDYAAASLITLAAALIGNNRTANVGGWPEPSILWAVLIGSPSSGKSPAMDPFRALISKFEDLSGERVLVDDVSAAGAGQIAAEAPRGLLLLNDELPSWWTRFPKLGGDQFWLKGFGARPHTVVRKDRAPIHVRRLAISVLGGAQPDAIRSFTASKESRGFASRWLYIYPEPKSTFRIGSQADHVLAEAALNRLMALGDGSETIPCPLTDEARALVEPWVGAKRAKTADQEGIWGEWLGKQGGVALRLALVFEYLWWAAEAPYADEPPAQISTEAYQAAIRFIDEYAAPMAERAFAMAALPLEDKLGAKLAKLLQGSRATKFNARDVRRGSLGPAGELSGAAAMTTACEALEHACLIRHVGQRAGGGHGRLPANYDVNPRLLT